MKTFILLTKLSPEISMHMKERQTLGRNWLEEVKQKCPTVKFLSHYALLGTYDFIDIYEAPDDETAAMVSLISRENGASEAQSLTAIPYKDFVELTKKL
ncbi:GYD domain-containing protein [Bacteroidota bacterium]